MKAERFSRRQSPYLFFLLAALFLTGLFSYAALLFTSLPLWLAVLIAFNLSSFTLVKYDKSIAGSNATRLPELTLFILAALGASVGVLLASRLFRHKTHKASFQLVIGVIFAIQLLVLHLLQTNTGWLALR